MDWQQIDLELVDDSPNRHKAAPDRRNWDVAYKEFKRDCNIFIVQLYDIQSQILPIRYTVKSQWMNKSHPVSQMAKKGLKVWTSLLS